MKVEYLNEYNSNISGYREPNIVKAQFTVTPTRIYNLEFDQNISMSELKTMIQKAAHLRSKNFRLFSNGDEYTMYNQESFESLFDNQKLVAFTLEIKIGEEYDETELTLQMNCPCSQHIDKFLLYYCFTCGKSICCDCFTIGIHKGHKIQDKCFYLLPSKFLVEKLFENWSQNPYEDYKYTEDKTLAELRININTVIFDKLFKLLKEIQKKVTNLIEQYHYINIQSSERIRNSIRDIKTNCIKILDELKEKMNIKEIINNENIFIDFDTAYKKLGKLHNDKFNYNVFSYTEFTQQIPILVKKMINDINDKLLYNLNEINNDKNYENILNQIKIKSVKSFDQEEIDKQVKSHIKSQYKDFTQKRLTINYKDDLDYKSNTSFEKIKVNGQSGRKTYGPNLSSIELHKNNLDNELNKIINQKNNLYSYGNSNLTQINNIQHKEYPNLLIDTNSNINNSINNNNINNNINNNLNEAKIIETTTTTTVERKIIGNPSSNIQSGNIQSNLAIKPIHKHNNINNMINKEENMSKNRNNNDLFSTAQVNKQIISITGKPIIYSDIQNKDKISINNTLNDSYGSNNTIKNINQLAEEHINSKFSGNFHPYIYNTQEIKRSSDQINKINQKTISSYINNTNIKTNINNQNLGKFFSFGINRNIIPEEITESETEVYNNYFRNFLNKEYILAPITQTNGVKIVTNDKNEERTIPLIFPNNLNINSFLLECGYCNFNKVLYVTGGIKEKMETNITLSINLNKTENQITKLSNMNYNRCCHSMISYDHYLLAVGGKNLSSVERYNTINNIWEKMSPMNYKRMYPILVIFNEYLYAFFGKSSNEEFCNTIERIKIYNYGIEKNYWEMVSFNNPFNIDTRIYGCAVHILGDSMYLFGGKLNDKTTDNILYFDFDKNILIKDESKMEKGESFRENKLYEFGDKLIQISDHNYFGTYIKINIL